MATTAEQLRQGQRTLLPQPGVAGTLKAGPRRSVLDPWLRGQAINITRHAAAPIRFTGMSFTARRGAD